MAATRLSSSTTFPKTPQTPQCQSPLVPQDHPEEPRPLRLHGLVVPLPPGGAHHHKPTGPGDTIDRDGGSGGGGAGGAGAGAGAGAGGAGAGAGADGCGGGGDDGGGGGGALHHKCTGAGDRAWNVFSVS